MHASQRFAGRLLALALVATLAPLSAVHAQSANNSDRARGKQMLGMMKDDIVKHYYDPTYHGVDVEARFKAAQEEIDRAQSNSAVLAAIAKFFSDFRDSHLYFIPPPRSVRVEYGWQMEMVGDACMVTAVRPGSDAEAKGLKPGDRISSIDGIRPTRANLNVVKYSYYALNPRPGMRVTAVDPAGKEKQLAIAARATQLKRFLDMSQPDSGDLDQLIREAQAEARLRRHRYVKIGETMIWKMPQFDLDNREVDRLMGDVKGCKALVLDMRGNGGGRVDMLLRLIGTLFDRDVKVGELKGRKEMEPMLAKTRGGDAVFKGTVVALVDSESASASELLARIMQLEKRGVVIGDRSQGAVMRSRSRGYRSGMGTVVFFGASITDADIVMADGKSLENTGVQPDEVVLPAGADLLAGRDPALARAATLAGLPLDAEAAGLLFPIEWQK
jgi:C-terminal processing protease CtpA/Prc